MNTGAQLRADDSIVDLSHEERVESVAQGASESFQPEAIDDSWRRSLLDFRVDPRSSSVPHLLTEQSSGSLANPCIAFWSSPRRDRPPLCHCSPDLYVVLLCNSDGVAIHHRGDNGRTTSSSAGYLARRRLVGTGRTNGIGTASRIDGRFAFVCRTFSRVPG
jgi:transcriptional regulator of acetoin/glycerol metabolism